MGSKKEDVRTYFTRRVKSYMHMIFVILSGWCQAEFDFLG